MAPREAEADAECDAGGPYARGGREPQFRPSDPVAERRVPLAEHLAVLADGQQRERDGHEAEGDLEAREELAAVMTEPNVPSHPDAVHRNSALTAAAALMRPSRARVSWRAVPVPVRARYSQWILPWWYFH